VHYTHLIMRVLKPQTSKLTTLTATFNNNYINNIKDYYVPLKCVLFSSFQPFSFDMGRLAPLSEEPINEENERKLSKHNSKKGFQLWMNWSWIKTHFSLVFNKKSNLKMLLSVLGCPLFPVPIHPKSPLNEVSFFVPCNSILYFYN